MKIKVKQQSEPKPTTQHGKIIKHLRQHGQITNAQLVNMYILRGSERMRELRAEGRGISDAYIVQGHIFAYDLVSDPFKVEVRVNKGIA